MMLARIANGVCGWAFVVLCAAGARAGLSGAAHERSGQPTPELTRAAEVKALRPEELNRRRPVHLEGVITYYDPAARLCFFQDDSGGIAVSTRTKDKDLALHPGQRCELRGFTATGATGAMIEADSFTDLANAGLPAAPPIGSSALENEAMQFEWVAVEGQIRAMFESNGRQAYHVVLEGKRLTVIVNVLSRYPEPSLIGRSILARGVFLPRGWDGGKAPVMLSPFPSCIQIAESSSGPAALAIPSIGEVVKIPNGTRVRLRMRVTDCEPGLWIEGEDHTGRIRALTSQWTPAARGMVIELLAFVRAEGTRVILEDGSFQRVGFVLPDKPFPARPGENPRVIRSAAEIRRLSIAEAARGGPVQLRGVITFFDRDWKLLFFQGATEGIYIDTHGHELDLKPSQLVLVEGTTGPGLFAPVVQNPVFEVLGEAPMPEPKKVTFAEMMTGAEDSQWIETEGVIEGISRDGGMVKFDMAPPRGEGKFVMYLPSARERTPNELLGARVQAQAACATVFNDRRELRGIQLFTPALRHIRVLERAPGDPFRTAAVPIDQLFRFAPDQAANRLTHIRGTITYAAQGRLYVEDSTGGILILPESPAAAKIGDHIDIVGFAKQSGMVRALEKARWKPAPPGPGIPPRKIEPERELSEEANLDARLVELEGTLVETGRSAEAVYLLASRGNHLFNIEFPRTMSGMARGLRLGSRLKITGVCSAQYDPGGNLLGFSVLAREPADIVVLSAPPRWSLKHVLIAAGLLAAAAIAGWAWVVTLRARVRQQTRIIQENSRAREKLEKELLRSQKMEMVGRLAGGIAHDFNNLLTIISSYGELLHSEPLTSTGADCAQEIRRAASRAADLTRQLLMFSRKQVMKRAPLDLNEVSRSMAKMLVRILGEDITLELRLCDEALFVEADRGMIEQVLMNLAVNARDAMPKGGRLCIHSSLRPIDAMEAAAHPGAAAGLHAVLAVSDTGCGISQEHLPRIFEPFFTTKEMGAGTGLGLATVYGIVQEHDGWVNVESTVGSGTTFEVFIPATSASGAPDAAPVSTTRPRKGKETILLIEDDHHVRKLASRVLTRNGYTVLQASSGPDALRLLNHDAPRIDLAITDLVMPGGLTGIDLCEPLREAFPGLPILITSGYVSQAKERLGNLEPNTRFLEKPYGPDKLLSTVGEIFARNN